MIPAEADQVYGDCAGLAPEQLPVGLGDDGLQGARLLCLCQRHRGETHRHAMGKQDAIPGERASYIQSTRLTTEYCMH